MPERDCLVFGYKAWGYQFSESPPFRVPDTRRIKMRFRIGSLLPKDDATPLKVLRNGVVVWVDEVPVWWTRSRITFDTPPNVSFGENLIHSNDATVNCPVRLEHMSARPIASWRAGAFTRLEVMLAGRGEAGIEPLIRTGTAGAADLISVEWLNGGKARLHYDHWGVGTYASEPFDWPADVVHRVFVQCPAFLGIGRGALGSAETGALKVEFDGEKVWEREVPFFIAAADQISVGLNDIGASTARGEFAGVIIDILQH
jgi:hypothetical protein